MGTQGCTDNIGICIASGIMICLIYIFFIPFMSIVTIKFYRIRHYQGISARYPAIIIAYSIFNICHIFLIDQYMLIWCGISPVTIQNTTILSIVSILSNSFLLVIPIYTILRIWLVNYDIKIALAKSIHDWQLLLSDTVNQNDWYSINKNKWGNWKWLTKVSICCWCLLTLFIIIPFSVNSSDTISQLIHIFFLFILLFPIALIWWKMPHFEDTFFIKQEMKLLLSFDISLGIIWFSLIYWSKPGNIFDLIQRIIIISLHFIQVYISVHWVINKQRQLNIYKRRTQIVHKNRLMQTFCDFINFRNIDAEFDNANNFSRASVVGRGRSKSVEQRYLGNKQLFNVLMANDIGINKLFEHLKHEFSFENVLFFIEIIQWLYHVTKKDFDKYDITPMSDISFEFSDIVPISSINNTNDSWFMKINAIYAKYIKSSAEYQVNLPGTIQNEYFNLIRLYDIKLEIDKGIYIPKKKRKTHHKPKTSFWNRSKLWNRHTEKPPDISKQMPKQIKFKHHPASDPSDGNIITRSQTEEIMRKFSTAPTRTGNKLLKIGISTASIPEHKTLTPTPSNKHKKNGTVDLGTIAIDRNKLSKITNICNELALEQKPNFSEGDASPNHNKLHDRIRKKFKNNKTKSPKLISPMMSPMMSRQNTFVEHQSIVTDSEDESDDNIEVLVNVNYENNGKSTISFQTTVNSTDPHLSDCDELSVDNQADNDINWGSSEMVFNIDTTSMDDDINNNNNNKPPMISTSILQPSAITASTSGSKHGHHGNSTESKLENIWNETIEDSDNNGLDIKMMTMKSIEEGSCEHDNNDEEEYKDFKQNITMNNTLMLPIINGMETSETPLNGKKSPTGIALTFSKLSSLLPLAISPSMTNNISEIDMEEEIDKEEQKQMDLAKSIELNNFVSLSCRAVFEILKLNYQSVARFKRAKQFESFQENVNLKDLLNKFGQKGCV
eukprot:287681_1